ncbi:putative RNA binding protein [Trypanosoma grayi]|uniref:putative RNA binding protein n=1 Tax=Trypanosoma grayi TaxID=71804 RepID=UPI0004F498F0|nr:putative RNA binding protein [Trypanosoma grayi]KEG10923.1 putative RNA binding protein [Trypanosoma grayi]
MSLTAELFGSSAPSSSSALALATAGVAGAAGASEEKKSTAEKPSISFEPTKKAAFDLFAVAPQVKKATRKEKQRLRLLGDAAAKKGTQGGKGVVSDGVQDDIFATVFLDDNDKAGDGADKKTAKRKKHLRHALQNNEEEENRTVFVGNLVNDVKRRAVERIFKSCGAIECVRIRAQALEEEGRKKNEGEENQKSRASVGRAIRVLRGEIKKGDQYSAVAYVLFKDKASVANALKLNGVVADGHHIVVTGMDAESRAYAPETSVFIGNIAYDTNEEAVWNFFVEKGVADVKRVRLVRDRETGSCKGFGYVEFYASSSVPKAIAVRGSLLNGREVRIVHVQKSKAVKAATASRREKRKREEQGGPNGGGKNDKRMNKKARREERTSDRRNNTDGQPSWMGVTTNPRKKIPKDLRPIVEGKKNRPPSGPRAPVKRKLRNPEK